jgi:hypothetical protein
MFDDDALDHTERGNGYEEMMGRTTKTKRAQTWRAHHTQRMWFVLLLACLTLPACTWRDSDEEPVEEPTSLCEQDSECPGEQICAQNVCTIAQAHETRRLGFTFIPENSSSFLPQRTMQLEIAPGDQLDFVLEPSIVVEGEISLADSPNIIQRGTIVFEPAGNPDNLLRHQTSIQPSGRFDIELLPGTYDVTFVSAESDLPNRRWLGIEIGNASTSLPLTLPSRNKLVTINGTITHRDPDLGLQSAPLPVEGARVLAVAADGTTSTTGVTDERGRYQIQVWEDTGANNLSIGPSSPDTLIPRVVEQKVLDPSKQDQLTPSTMIGTWRASSTEIKFDPLLVEALEEELELLRTSRMGEDSKEKDNDELDITEWKVTARAKLDRGNLDVNFTLDEAIADETGQGITVLTVPHEIIIRPPANYPIGQISFEIPANGVNLIELAILEIPLRRKVNGTVLDAQGQPLANARLEMRHVMKTEGASTKSAFSSEDQRLLTLETDDDGVFTAWLEPNWEYDVVVSPSTSTNAPRGIFALAPGDEEVTFTMPEPMLIYGSVLDANLEGQGNLLVEVYESFRNERRVISETRTSADGSFRMIAPAAAPRE